ncbi:transcriptional regulator [Burkholderia pseudomallei]|uniref:transcriptional regulator n=1 Tax=Burkholderia pseudomallei TaxID=28450 RepID=UPI001E3BE196|nr:transcriptional regulator [Burkholderia pseudomallei]
MDSILFRPIEDQPELALTRRPDMIEMPIEMIRSKRTAGAAFTLACDASGLEDKEIAMALNIDAGTFSKMKKGMATLNGDALREFCKVVGNRIYSEWLAYQVGCTLVMIQTEAERIAAEERARREEAERENKLLRELLAGRSA